MKQPIKTILPLAAFAAVATTGATQAAVIQPFSASASSELGGYEADDTVNGNGLTGAGTILTQVSGNGSDQWLSGTDASSSENTAITVTIDLGGTYDIDGIHLWNAVYSNGAHGNWSVQSMDISFQINGAGGYVDTVQDVAFTKTASTVSSSVQTQSFATVSNVTHIQFTDVRNFASNRVGFGEIRFSEAVPEPSTTALLGLGGLALILRRRK